MESEHVNMRDRYANSSFNVGIGEVPEYLQFKKKQLQGCVQQKKKIKQVLVHNPNLTAGNILNIRFASNNFIDPQSVKLGFQLGIKKSDANALGNTKFNDDCGLQGMIRSIKVSSAGGGKQLESIYNYNLLQKLQYALSVSATAKQTQLWSEGFGSVPGASGITNGPPISVTAGAVIGTQYLIPLHTGLLGGNTRLIPNGLIQLSVDIELAPLMDFLVGTNVDFTVYYVNNCYVTYDEYIVSDAYRSIFESAVRTSGLSFDFNTITNVETQLAGANLNIQSVVVDSSKQLLSLYTVMRPAGATFGNGTTATSLETIVGSKVTSMQWKVGTVNYPEFVLTNTTDMFHMALQSMNRANVLMSSMPISWSKYAGNGRCFFGGVDFEQTRTSPDSNVYSGISTNGNQITFQATLSDTTASDANAGAVATAALGHGDGDTGMVIDHFLYHSRILSISPVGGVVVDY